MTPTLGSVLEAHAVALPGRDAERARLLALVAAERPLFACVHGIAGIGKSALLRAFAGDARAAGARVVVLDGGAVEPTERGFLAALGDELGAPVELDGLADALGPGRVVLVLDGYDQLRLLDGWIRRRLVPALPLGARLLVAGREEPGAWRRSFGELAAFVRLGSLAPDAALDVLARAGLDADAAARAQRLAQGHPLALQLAAGVPDAGAAVVEELAALYLAELAPATRRALEAACVVRRASAALLAAMGMEDAFEDLRALPFVELARDGLVVHETVRAVTLALLDAADPDARRRHRAAAWTHLRRAARAPADTWRCTADMLYLAEDPALREAFFPGGGEAYVAEPATPADRSAIEAIAARHESPAELARLRAWWRDVPEAFRVARAPDGTVAAFGAMARDALPHRLYAEDPVAAAWRAALRADPLPRGARVLFDRWCLGRDAGEEPGPQVAALWLDIKRDYLELRPALRRVYLAGRELPTLCPRLSGLGFAVIGPAGDRSLAMVDFGPGSTDGWLARLVGEAVAEGDPVPDLTPLESRMLAYLRARPGVAVSRETLLREVWGHAWTGGSANAVEVVVSALRRKLGDRAGALVTVRGVGYRLDWV